jgi:zinc transport system substrate-binding protein
MIRIGSADLFVYTNDIMEPWAVRLLKGLSGAHRPEVVEASTGLTLAKATDTGEEHGHGGGLDPHVWLDFANAQKMVDTVAAGLARRDPAGRELYRANAEAYKRKLADLDERYRRGLAACRSRVFLHGGHYAFGYLARRYDLTYISAYALSADAEPTPGRMMELTRQVRGNGLKYIFYEELISPRAAETIARETGAQLLQLHGAHNISRDDLAKGATFLSLMELNLEHLRTGLQCR